MEDVSGRISLYHNLFLVCLTLGVLCLVLAVVLFFVLDMRSVIGYLTGRSARKQIQALEESNAASGRLMPRERTNMQYVAQEMKADMGIRGAAVPGARKVDHVVQKNAGQGNSIGLENNAGKGNGAGLGSNAEGMEATTLLKENAGIQETSVLKQGTEEQQKIQGANPSDGSTATLDGSQIKPGIFVIEREIILIHAEEVI